MRFMSQEECSAVPLARWMPEVLEVLFSGNIR